MLKIVTGCWGDKYPQDYIFKWAQNVFRNISRPYEVYIHTESDWPGWWGKLKVFTQHTGPTLWIDIDCAVIGNLDRLVAKGTRGGDLVAAKNWAQSGHGGIQSSVVYWEDLTWLLDDFDESNICWPPEKRTGPFWGDQEFLTHLRDRGKLHHAEFDPQNILSYKYHCRGRSILHAETSVVCFHGKPDPHEVTEEWLDWD
jgi:hypothetical protein